MPSHHAPKQLDTRLVAQPIVHRHERISSAIPAAHVSETITRIAGLLNNVQISWRDPVNRTPSMPADCSVIVGQSFPHIVPQLSEELYGGRTTHHIFLVSLCETEPDKHIVEQLVNAAPATAKKVNELLIPHNYADQPLEFTEPTKQGIVSVHTLRSIRANFKPLLQSIWLACAMKYEDYRRTDIDEDGRTIQKDMYEGWDKWIFLTEEEMKADEWKGEGYKAPWEDTDDED